MAESKKILASDVIEKDIFNNTIKNGKELIVVLQDVQKGFKSQLEVQSSIVKETKLNLDNAESIRKVTKVRVEGQKIRKALTESEKQEIKLKKELVDLETREERLKQTINRTVIQERKEKERIAKVEKQENKLKKQLQQLTDEEVKGKLRFNAANKAQRDELKDLLILEDKQAGTLQKLRAENKKLRREREKLNLTTDEGVKRLKEINTQLDLNNSAIKDNSDALDKQRQNVGNYEESINNALNANENFRGSFLEIINNITIISQQEGGIKSFFQAFVGGIGQAIKAGLKFILTPIGATIFAIVAGIKLFSEAIQRNQSASDKFGEIWSGITTVLDIVIDRLITFAKGYFEIIGGILSADLDLIKKGWSNLEKAISGVGDSMFDAFEKGKKLKQLQKDIEILNISNTKELAKLNAELEKQNSIADDSTLSFKRRRDAALEAMKLTEEASKLSNEQAKLELEEVNLRLEIARDSGKINRGLLQEQADAISNVIEKEKEFTQSVLENNKTRRELKQDELERDLDIQIDGFDNQKTINEKLISDERKTLSERQTILDETRKLSDNSFKAQTETIQKFTKKQIDFNDLLETSDAVQLNKKIRSLGLSEIIEGRLLEVIRERRTVESDLTQEQINLDIQRLDLRRRILDLENSIERDNRQLKIDLLNEELSLEDITSKRRQEIIKEIKDVRIELLKEEARISSENAKKDIVDKKELAKKELEIDTKLKNDLTRLDIEFRDKKRQLDKKEQDEKKQKAKKDELDQKKIDDRILKQKKELANQIINETQNEINKVFELRNQANEKEIENRQKSVDIQEERARQGQENQLAFEQERLAQSEVKRREDLERQRRAEEAIRLSNIYLEAYLNALGQPDTNAAQAGVQAFASAALAKGVSRGIAGNFIEGTEMVERDLKGNKVHNRTDGYHIAVDGKERILNPEQNAKIGNISNDELAQMAFDYRTGVSPYIYKPLSENVFVESKSDNTDVIYAINNLGKIVKENASKIDVDKLGNLIHQTYKNGIKTTTKYKNRPRL